MRETVQRAFSSFLAVPSAVILGFVLLAVGSYAIEQADLAMLAPARDFMRSHVFGSPEATSALLGTIAGGVITITSITFSLLLLALQQSAGSMTHQVFDQFLRRRVNQVYFGAFVGITLFALITLATVNPPFNPVLGASIALLLTLIALYILLLLIYATINQMRPTEIIKTIHDHTLRARERQLDLVRRTRRAARKAALEPAIAQAPSDGFVVGIDLQALKAAVQDASGSVEIELTVSIGTYVAWHDPIARVRGAGPDDDASLIEAVVDAVTVGRDRDLGTDPAYGIEQLETIAWRSISTSQQNPAPGIAAIRNLRDLLARWADASDTGDVDERLPVVYPDNLMASLYGAIESLSVVASESMQHQTLAEILASVAISFDRVPEARQRDAVNLVLRSLAGMGDHVLSTELERAITEVADAFAGGGYLDAASRVRTARDALGASVGELNSRSTRVPTG